MTWNGGTYTEWETPWDFSILLSCDGNDLLCKYNNLPYWSSEGYAAISSQWLPTLLKTMEENPKKLSTKPASVIMLEKELNMTAKLHYWFGCWYLCPNNEDCPIDGMFNNPFNIPIATAIDEWSFDVIYKDSGATSNQTISDIFKYILLV